MRGGDGGEEDLCAAVRGPPLSFPGGDSPSLGHEPQDDPPSPSFIAKAWSLQPFQEFQSPRLKEFSQTEQPLAVTQPNPEPPSPSSPSEHI